MEAEFRSERRVDAQHRSNRRLLRRGRQRQIQFPDGFHHDDARLERNRIRRAHASAGASERSGRTPVELRLPPEIRFAATKPHIRPGSFVRSFVRKCAIQFRNCFLPVSVAYALRRGVVSEI